ncbi:MAG: antitermination protein NusG [Planctomycetales bacterium]|nr:antitermination protein NusG [Planctomycetales bacterium]NIM09746.1 antitermination protein NusG [Planctomycetales bacterium]NIN09214.1 antitermination protein NusG [Planctomycetales bacterium]NIN78314.1 antitermination protein NusG [Planctomycetales bacterium]NIO35491.1 antitermination protein NusG [Planctomycetales bacterium]
MPILPKEPDIFPCDLLVDETVQQVDRWWAIYTLSRREKDLVRRLRTQSIYHYCPLIKRRSRSPSGRVRESYVPLFAGYVFLAGTEEHRYEAMKSNCISRCLEIDDPQQLIFDLRQIQQLVESDAPLSPEARISAGDPVRVRSGPFKGLEGVVIQRRGQQRLLVSIHFLQQGASVLIEDYQLEQI